MINGFWMQQARCFPFTHPNCFQPRVLMFDCGTGETKWMLYSFTEDNMVSMLEGESPVVRTVVYICTHMGIRSTLIHPHAHVSLGCLHPTYTHNFHYLKPHTQQTCEYRVLALNASLLIQTNTTAKSYSHIYYSHLSFHRSPPVVPE